MIGRSVGGLGAGAETEIDGGVLGRPFLAEHLPELERIVVGEKDVVS